MKIILLSALFLLLFACASSPPSEQITRVPDNEITLAEAVETPILFEQSTVRWGGRVLKAEVVGDNTDEGRFLRVEIIDFPLDEKGKPLADASPGSRFIAHVNEGDETLTELQGKVFKRNAFVTVVGRLYGSERVELSNGQAQQLPIINTDDFYRWSYTPKESRHNNGVSFGIGIGITL